MYKIILLDIDGVIKKGKETVVGSVEAVEKLSKRFDVLFMTNSGSSSKRQKVEMLKESGFPADMNNTYCASEETAIAASEMCERKRVFCFGEDGLKEEMMNKGLKLEDEDVDAVVAGIDRDMTYRKYLTAFREIRKGAAFISTNRDRYYPKENEMFPGSGVVVRALEEITGRQSICIGKPETRMIERAAREWEAKPKDVLVVGDNLETDIEMANRFGSDSALVLTGASSKEDIGKKKAKPKMIEKSIRELAEKLSGT